MLANSNLFSTNKADSFSALRSVGIVTFRWRLDTDRLLWSAGAIHILGLDSLPLTGQSLSKILGPGAFLNRAMVMASWNKDHERNHEYKVAYAAPIGRNQNAFVEETGHWIASRDGQPIQIDAVMQLRLIPRDLQGLEIIEIEKSNYEKFTIFFDCLSSWVEEKNDCLSQFYLLRIDLKDENIRIQDGDLKLNHCLRMGDRLFILSECQWALMARLPDSKRLPDLLKRVQACLGPVPIGVVASSSEADALTLLACAEDQLRQAKQSRGRTAMLAPGQIGVRHNQRKQASQGIAHLNQRRELVSLHPIYDCRKNQLAFFECCLRFDQGNDPISTWKYLSNKVRMLCYHRLLERTLRLLAEDRAVTLLIRMPSAVIGHPDILGLAEMNNPYGIKSRLIIELEQTASLTADALRRLVATLKGQGARLAATAGGPGEVDLADLRNLNIDMIRFESPMIQKLMWSPDMRFALRGMIKDARTWGIDTLADWAGDHETAGLLTSFGCHYLQDNFYPANQLGAPPMHAPSKGFLEAEAAVF